MGCSSGDGSYDYANSKGAALYQDMCQVCHGETGEGGLGPAIRDSRSSVGQLEHVISERMPANAPGQCTGECATELANFIHDGLNSKALACSAVPPARRRLRLLTRREYRATVHDLFGDMAPVMACAKATDCAYRDTCTAAQCEPTACDAQTFVYDPQGRTYASVHVAGDFNSWASTIAGGGLALTYDAATKLWVGTFTVGAGHHLYKLVLDEQQWIADPRSPMTAADGFGGQNSVAEVACSTGLVGDPAAGFPVESHKAGFPFDTDAAAALVTSTHVDAYLASAEKLADFAAANPENLVSCDWAKDRAGCGHSLVTDFGKKLFRRPLESEEVDRYNALIAGGTDATDGVATALHAMLVSPAFLYRSELGEPTDNGRYRLTPYEIATALSYTFIGTTPSTELLAAAGHGELSSTAGIEKWARMLLADSRARQQVGEYVLQWTGAQNVLTAEKRPDLYPDWEATRIALATETREFAAKVIFDGTGTFEELMTAPNPDGKRAGLLGQRSVLATSAHSDQTSPVLRGLLVRRNFLCQDLPPPPPNGGTVPAIDPNATTRDRFSMHSSSPACRGCHMYIDSIGFGLENFDPVGRWRDTENGKPIDASGDMNDVEQLGTDTGAPFTSLPQLATTIASSHAAQSCFVRQYLRFSRGVRETLAERCARLRVEDKFQAAKGDIRELMVQSVLSSDFVERR
ncbi:MAG TPA: DUF1588 domain-containing protein [Kofleriaceae bacterium]|nr:DUF1588 domain-containing protein [Kofleriaceae bacterium]